MGNASSWKDALDYTVGTITTLALPLEIVGDDIAGDDIFHSKYGGCRQGKDAVECLESSAAMLVDQNESKNNRKSFYNVFIPDKLPIMDYEKGSLQIFDVGLANDTLLKDWASPGNNWRPYPAAKRVTQSSLVAPPKLENYKNIPNDKLYEVRGEHHLAMWQPFLLPTRMDGRPINPKSGKILFSETATQDKFENSICNQKSATFVWKSYFGNFSKPDKGEQITKENAKYKIKNDSAYFLFSGFFIDNEQNVHFLSLDEIESDFDALKVDNETPNYFILSDVKLKTAWHTVPRCSRKLDKLDKITEERPFGSLDDANSTMSFVNDFCFNFQQNSFIPLDKVNTKKCYSVKTKNDCVARDANGDKPCDYDEKKGKCFRRKALPALQNDFCKTFRMKTKINKNWRSMIDIFQKTHPTRIESSCKRDDDYLKFVKNLLGNDISAYQIESDKTFHCFYTPCNDEKNVLIDFDQKMKKNCNGDVCRKKLRIGEINFVNDDGASVDVNAFCKIGEFANDIDDCKKEEDKISCFRRKMAEHRLTSAREIKNLQNKNCNQEFNVSTGKFSWSKACKFK